MGKVFVTQQPRPNGKGWTPNLSPAAKFGAIHFIFNGDEKPYTNANEAMEKAVDALWDFDPEEDYILCPYTGDPVAAWVTMLVIGRLNIPFVRLLNWERELKHGRRSTTDGFYTPITITL